MYLPTHSGGVSHTYVNIPARWIDTDRPYAIPSDRLLPSLGKRSRRRVNALYQQ